MMMESTEEEYVWEANIHSSMHTHKQPYPQQTKVLDETPE